VGYLTAFQRSVSSSVADALNTRAISTPRGGQQYAASVSNLLARVFHLIRQPVALLFLSALSKSLLLVAINSRQLTNSMLVFTPGGIVSEYEFRSWHSTSQLSSPNAAPLNNVRTTRSHFSLLPCSRYVSAAFRSSSLSARRPWLASFCALYDGFLACAARGPWPRLLSLGTYPPAVTCRANAGRMSPFRRHRRCYRCCKPNETRGRSVCGLGRRGITEEALPQRP
jgi:hypothetical protein